MNDKPKPRRRFRYSLRTLFLLVTVVSISFGWFGNKLRQAQRQKEAVAAIEKLGGYVTYDYEIVPSRHPAGEAKVDLTAKPPGPAWVQEPIRKDGLSNVVGVNIYGSQITDRTLDHLTVFPKLDWLSIRGAQITDAGLAKLRDLTRLNSLDIRNTKITDAGLVHLREMTQLKSLDLVETQITEEGFQELRKALPNLHIYQYP